MSTEIYVTEISQAEMKPCSCACRKVKGGIASGLGGARALLFGDGMVAIAVSCWGARKVELVDERFAVAVSARPSLRVGH